MTLRSLAICVVLATVSASAGCVTHCHKGFKKALDQVTEYDLPPRCRGQVHVFMIHGLAPSSDSVLSALRLNLAQNGFAKVGLCGACDPWWVKSEVACIRQHDPDARFVLLGYDCGGPVACWLARSLAEKGVSVDAVVLLNPVGCSAEPCGAQTLLITTPKCVTCVPHAQKVVVPDVSHFGLPNSPQTVSAVTALLSEIAAGNCQPPVEEQPAWGYPHAPEVRRIPNKPQGSDWDFLADRPGPTRSIGTQTAAQPVAQPKAGPVTAAGAVILKP
ncbi:MAG: hypothetical protein ACKODX_20315 [Gemmata sp.]